MGTPTEIPLQNVVIKLIADLVKEQLNYVVNYEKKVEELDSVVEKLQQERERVNDKIKEEKDRHGRVIYDDVTEWLDGVDEIIFEYETFKKEDDRDHAGCSVGFPPNLAIRYRRSKAAEDIKGKVNRQLERANHDDISRWGGPPSMGVAFTNIDYQRFESRTETMNKIMAALKDSGARMIGVHGPTGVGKTTLVIKAANMAREERLFNLVIMANVTKSPDIRKIQGQIADMLGMKLEEESEHARAVRIQERLKKEKESTLIILDDLGAKVDLNILGIPSEIHNDGNASQKNFNPKEGKSSAAVALNKTETKQTPGRGAIKTEKTSGGSSKSKTEELHKGCKVLLISEVRQVLSQMDVEASLIFSVNVLNGQEAETLFKKMAGIVDKNSEFGKLAAQIAKKCNRLPMSIVTTARALKNQSHSVWEDTSLKLERQKLTGTPEYSTKLSYQLLENVELKITFLLCARMDHDALVTDLVKHCIGLGFLQGIYTVREARDRVQSLLAKLKQSGLLSDSYSSDRFTMQNLVRNAALSIASEESHVFTLTEGKLDEWPDEDILERYTAISLRRCDVIEEFPKSIKCPRLRVFHVDNNDSRLKIPYEFFQEMKELRVLILIGIHLSPLPPSIRCLTKLRMLCLEQCTLGEQLCIIGELKNLRILSFSGSDIESLPVELKQLSKLQIFDISNCSKLRVIPPNVISSLTSLEELYMRNVLIEWRVDEGKERQAENASLSELGHLNKLTNLDIQIQSVAHLPKNLFFDKLYSYKIVIGSSNRYIELDFKMPEKYELSRFLAIQQKDGFYIHSQKGIKMLFERVENLLLEKLNGVQDVFYELNLKGFPYLKHLTIVSNSEIQSLINPKDRKLYDENAFPKLESLDLYKLKNMKEICSSSCKLSAPTFGKLKIVKIKLCGQLKTVFLISMVKLLTALETIQVSECSSLKEIVHVENANKIELLTFPELRSLTLQFLSEFIGFYPISAAEGTKVLFHEKVVVSKLERMELSSIQIEKLWIGQSPHFPNLIHLEVNGCGNLKYLLSFSMARNLKNLQSLSISECDKMGHIFLRGQGNDAKRKQPKQGSIFPNLKNIKLSSMKSLREIWDSEVPADSFGKLDTLIIEECNKFVNVFPCYMVGMFRSISSLTVTNCKSIKAIFYLADQKRGGRVATNLQDIHLESLPKLEHVLKWKKGCEGILSLNSLQKIWVHDCDNLENIFPVSVAKNLGNLEHLVVWDCFRLREIVAKGEDAKNNTSSSIEFKFPKLTTVKYLKLPKFKSFYPGACELSCPLLNDLSVELCDKLELFREETADALFREETTNASFREEAADVPPEEETTVAQSKPIIFPEEVINKLKSMQIELRHAELSTRFRRDKLEELHLSRLKNTDILYSFLHHNPNLKSLWLNDCSFEVLVPLERSHEIESLGVVPKLKSLQLTDLPNLKKIGFERDAILQRIEFLVLKNCPKLGTIAPSTLSLTHLKNLEVVDCEGLKYLMSPSTAKSLVQLSTMKVINCKSLEEIISEQGSEEEEEEEKEGGKEEEKMGGKEEEKKGGKEEEKEGGQEEQKGKEEQKENEKEKEKEEQEGKEEQEEKKEKEGENAGKVDIVFRQLKAIELVSLKSLKSFCSSRSCVFEFLSLEKFVMSACPKMEKFSQNFPQEVKSTPVLQKVYVVHDKEKKRSFWKGNLQATIQYMFENKKFFEGMDELSVSEHLDLEKVWQGKEGLPKDWFYSLKTLKLENCEFESYAIPCNVLRRLKSLKELEVRACNNVKVIFEMNDTKFRGTFQLKKLTLAELPDVTCVWQQDKQGFPSFNNLQQVTVTDCKKVKLLFPAALARDLKMLEILEVKNCDELLEIVGKEEEAADGTEKFVFPHLTKLELDTLPQLAHFYSERFTLECPELNILQVTDCNKLELFHSQQDAHSEGQGSTSIIRQPFFSDIKGISKVENLYLNWKDTSVLWSWLGQSTDQDLQHLYELGLLLDDDVDGNSTLPSEILEKTPNLEQMAIVDWRSLKEFPKIGNTMLGNFKRLFLFRLFELHSMGELELSKLQLFYVYRCPGLTTVVQSCSNHLRELYIVECHGLQCLFTSSAAKMLIHLEEMYVWDCESMKEIVAIEQDETAIEEIKFERLDRISLNSLSSLECFYSGNATLMLPSLIQVDIMQCSKMKTFSRGSIHVESSKGIQVSYDSNDDLVFHHDLNVAVERQFLHQTGLVLGDYPELEEKWLGLVPIPDDWSFSKLTSLVVEGCEFLSNAILPSHLLPFISNLEELVVRNCESVEAIFDVKDTPTHDSNMIVISLKKLTLEQLPTLRCVWNEDPKGILILPLLEEVIVKECKSIKSLLPASVDKSNLQKVDVRNCVELVEIVAKDEATTEEANEEAMFALLTSLTLWDLPNLRCICSGMHILDWPVLDDLDIYCCPMLKIFATDFQNSPNSYPECQDHFTTDKQGFVSSEKITPQLEVVSLSKEDIIMIEQGLLHVDLQKVKTFKLHSFDDESDAFPDTFFSEVALPSIQALSVANSAFEEIFPSQKPHIDYTKIFSQVNVLELKSLLKLKSIGLEHTWMAPILENLQILIISACSCLTNLVPSTVSFSHLAWLSVGDCAKLEYLFTSSTAKSLVELTNLSITNCESLEKVVAEEGDKPDEDVIFRTLTTLSLSKLPKLGSFYTGNSTLTFPWLYDISFTECKSMKTFSHGNVLPKSLQGKIDGVRWYGDLNIAVHQQFENGSSSELA